jgi:4-hydroxy-2-oxoheptanedioate aldolase
MVEFQTNPFKRALREGRLQIGLWSSLCSNIAAEIISDSGFDWILLDTEHSPNEIPDLVTQLQAVQRGTATPIIRPAWNDAVLAKRALDIGAQTLLFPYVQSVEEAKRAVASTRYPPQGIRGVSVAARASRYGRVPGYLNQGKCGDLRAGTGRNARRARPDRRNRRRRRDRRCFHRSLRPRRVTRSSWQPAAR